MAAKLAAVVSKIFSAIFLGAQGKGVINHFSRNPWGVVLKRFFYIFPVDWRGIAAEQEEIVVRFLLYFNQAFALKIKIYKLTN